MTITPERLAKLRELAQAATPGPWRVERSRDTTAEWVVTYCRKDFFGDLACVVPAAAEAGWQLDPRDIAYIAAANPQTVLALVEEVERLRDIETDLLVCESDCRDLQSFVAELRDSNAKVTDARDNLLDEVGRLQEALADLRSVNEMQGKMLAQGPMDWDERTGLEMAALVHEAESKALRSYIHEMGRMLSVENWTGDPSDMVVQSALSSALQEIERLQARVAELEAAMAQRMGVYAAPKDERQVGS